MNLASATSQISPAILLPRQVHTITDRFSVANTYLIDAERLIVVDPGSKLSVQLLCSYLAQFLHRSPADIDLIVLTHMHTDHTAGVEELRRICNAPVAASALAQHLTQPKLPGRKELASRSYLSGQVLPGILQHLNIFSTVYTQQMKLVDIWLEDVAGLPEHPDWRVIANAGNTPGSLYLYNPFSEELLCGDTAITMQGGVTLLRGGRDRLQLEEMLQILRGLKVRYLYPDHGRPILSLHPFARVFVE